MKIDKQLIRQVILYGIIGSSCAFLDFIIFTLLHTHTAINEYLANIISVHIGLITSFILNRRINFQKIDRVIFRAISFYLTGLLGLTLSQFILWLGNALLLSILFSKFISILIVSAIQFLMNKLITFNK